MRSCCAQNISQKSKEGNVGDVVIIIIFRKTRVWDESLGNESWEMVYGTAWEVYYRCEIMQYVSRVNVYSYSKFNPPT